VPLVSDIDANLRRRVAITSTVLRPGCVHFCRPPSGCRLVGCQLVSWVAGAPRCSGVGRTRRSSGHLLRSRSFTRRRVVRSGLDRWRVRRRISAVGASGTSDPPIREGCDRAVDTLGSTGTP